jgi:hypothetical protein
LELSRKEILQKLLAKHFKFPLVKDFLVELLMLSEIHLMDWEKSRQVTTSLLSELPQEL